MKINLSILNSLEPLLELKTETGFIDLHNDYCLDDVRIKSEPNTLELFFKRVEATKEYKPKSKFEALIIEFKRPKIFLGIDDLLLEKGKSLDNLSKSKLIDGKKFSYIISFVDGEEYEIESEEATIYSNG